MPGGHWHHGELQADQMLMSRPVLGAAGYATPIDGAVPCRRRLASGRRHLRRARAERRPPHHGDEGIARCTGPPSACPSRPRLPSAATRPISARCRLASPFQPRLEALAQHRGLVQLGRLQRAAFAVGRGARIFRDPQPGGGVRHLADGEIPHRRPRTPRPSSTASPCATSRKLKPGRVHYTAWCDDEGHVLDDGTLFRLADDRFRLCCQERHLPWLLDSAVGFDGRHRGGDRSHCRAGAAGPDLLRRAARRRLRRRREAEASSTSPSFPHEGGPVTISRTGFTGDLGYELFVPARSALALWDRLFEAGRLHGIRAIGYARAQPRPHRGRADRRQCRFHHRRACASAPTGCACPTRSGWASWSMPTRAHFNGRRAILEARPRRHAAPCAGRAGDRRQHAGRARHRLPRRSARSALVSAGHVVADGQAQHRHRQPGAALSATPCVDELWVEIYAHARVAVPEADEAGEGRAAAVHQARPAQRQSAGGFLSMADERRARSRRAMGADQHAARRRLVGPHPLCRGDVLLQARRDDRRDAGGLPHLRPARPRGPAADHPRPRRRQGLAGALPRRGVTNGPQAC